MSKITPRAEGLIAINLAAVIFGSAALYGKMDISPFWIVAMRAAFAAGALTLLAKLRGMFVPLAKQYYGVMAGTGAILAMHWLTFFASVQWAGIAIATLTFAAFPLFTVLFEAIAHKRAPHIKGIVAGGMIILAVALLMGEAADGQEKLLGTLAGLASAITFAVFGLASKRMGQALSPLTISIYQNAVVAISMAAFLPFALPMPSTAAHWGLLLLLGVLTTALMHQLYFYALRRLSASTCSGFVALEPVYAIIFAALFFNEAITLWVAASGALILLASFILLSQENKAAEAQH